MKLLKLKFKIKLSYVDEKNLKRLTLIIQCNIYMSHFAYVCKMRYPLNLVLENIEYL